LNQLNVCGTANRLLSAGAICTLIETLTGHKPSRATIWRWALSGRLETRRIGGRLYATESALRRMLERDAMRNRGTAGARGLAAAERLQRLVDGRKGEA
jgi:hypothetical protein